MARRQSRADDEADERQKWEAMALKELARHRLLNPPHVLVTWEDAYSNVGWRSLEAIRCDDHVAVVRSVGFLVRDDDSAVRIVQTVSDGMGADPLTIPRAMVRTIEPMTPPDPSHNGR